MWRPGQALHGAEQGTPRHSIYAPIVHRAMIGKPTYIVPPVEWGGIGGRIGRTMPATIPIVVIPTTFTGIAELGSSER